MSISSVPSVAAMRPVALTPPTAAPQAAPTETEGDHDGDHGDAARPVASASTVGNGQSSIGSIMQAMLASTQKN